MLILLFCLSFMNILWVRIVIYLNMVNIANFLNENRVRVKEGSSSLNG